MLAPTTAHRCAASAFFFFFFAGNGYRERTEKGDQAGHGHADTLTHPNAPLQLPGKPLKHPRPHVPPGPRTAAARPPHGTLRGEGNLHLKTLEQGGGDATKGRKQGKNSGGPRPLAAGAPPPTPLTQAAAPAAGQHRLPGSGTTPRHTAPHHHTTPTTCTRSEHRPESATPHTEAPALKFPRPEHPADPANTP